MPRVLQSKHHPRFHPTSSATGVTRARRPFKYSVHKKTTNLQRVLVALHATRPTDPTAVQGILEKISDQAAENDEVLGRRSNQFVHIALSILRKNGYLQVQDEDDDEYCWLTEDGIRIITDADAWFGDSDLWNQFSSFEKHRRCGQYLQWLISPTPKRPLTRRELDIENRQLEWQLQEHTKVCPMLLGLESRPTNAALQNATPQDFMDVDEAPVAGPSTTHTPIRRSASLYNSAAYPTPESIPRARRSTRPASISPPQTPVSRNYSFGIQEEDHISDDDDQGGTTSVAITASNEGEMEGDQVVVSTCHNMDWGNIGHVTAISKALQEKNDILQQKLEVLEKEKEECIHQLDQANNKVEHIEAKMRDMRSQSWFLRWRYTTAMTVLQKALDSAIHERESHKGQNVRLQARLDDIERRRAAIRRIEDADNAPDDQLLTVITESLKFEALKLKGL